MVGVESTTLGLDNKCLMLRCCINKKKLSVTLYLQQHLKEKNNGVPSAPYLPSGMITGSTGGGWT